MSAIPPYVRSVIPVSNELLHTTQCFEVASELIWVLSFFWEMDSSVTRCVEKVIQASRVWRRWGLHSISNFGGLGKRPHDGQKRAPKRKGRDGKTRTKRQIETVAQARRRHVAERREKRESIPTQRYLRGQRLFGIVG